MFTFIIPECDSAAKSAHLHTPIHTPFSKQIN